MPGLFEYLDAISTSKKDLTRQDSGDMKEYVPFMINQGLSQHLDSILVVNELNKHPMVSKQMHHDYLFHSIRARKRLGKWAKKVEHDDLEVVMEFYGYSRTKANDALKILSVEQIKDLRDRMTIGGKLK